MSAETDKLFELIRENEDAASKRHLEVCQRLTALETRMWGTILRHALTAIIAVCATVAAYFAKGQ